MFAYAVNSFFRSFTALANYDEDSLEVIRYVYSDSVKDAIAALPEEITLADEATVEQIRADYESLNENEKAEITAEELAKLEAAETRIAELKQADPAEQLEQAIADKEQAEAAAAAAEQRAAEAEQAAATAQQQAAAAQIEAANAQIEAANAQAQLAQAQQDLEALQQSAEATEEELAQAQQSLEQAEQNLAQAQQTAAEATQRAINAENAAAEAEHNLAEAEQAVQTANAALVEANQEKETAQAAAAAAEERATAAEQRATEAEARAAAAEAALEDIENGTALQEAEARAAAAEAAAAAAEQRATDAEQRMTDAEARATAAEEALAAAQQALEDLQNGKTNLNEMNLNLEKNVEWAGGKEVCPYDYCIYPKGDIETLKINRDYIVSYENNIDVGTAKAVIKGKGDYSGTLTTTFNIVPYDLSSEFEDNVYLKKNKLVYTGSNVEPEVVIDINYPAKVTENDYTIAYPDESNAIGKYTVVVTFKGNYKGTAKLTYEIVPKGTALSKVTPGRKCFTAKWIKQAKQTTGYQLQYSTSSTFKSGNKSVLITKNSTVSKKVTKLKAKKKYYVRVRTYKTVDGTKIYSDWSAKKSVKTK